MATRPVIAPVTDEAGEAEPDVDSERLNRAFFALSDPVRRAILERLGEGPALVSEIAAPFDISLQAVSKHIQVLVRAGLIKQERSGRVAKCSLEAGPVFAATVWLNRYTEYWQAQFDALAGALGEIDGREPNRGGAKKKVRTSKIKRKHKSGRTRKP